MGGHAAESCSTQIEFEQVHATAQHEAEQSPLEGGSAGTEAGAPADKTDDHPEESPAAPVEKSGPSTEELPAMEGEPTPAEDKEQATAELKDSSSKVLS